MEVEKKESTLLLLLMAFYLSVSCYIYSTCTSTVLVHHIVFGLNSSFDKICRKIFKFEGSLLVFLLRVKVLMGNVTGELSK